MPRLIQTNTQFAGDLRMTLLLPRAYRRDGTRTLIVAMGGITQNYFAVTEATGLTPGSPGMDAVWSMSVVSTLLPYICDRGGYPILCLDAKSAASLGQTDCLTSITNALAWARLAVGTTPWPGPLTTKAAAPGVGFIGYSRGGLIAANWVARNLAEAAFLVTAAAPVDVDDVYDNNRGALAPYLDASYHALTGMNPKGDWHASVTYAIGDTVVSGGVPYRCTTAHTNSAPPSGNWAAITTGGAGAWKTNGRAASPSFNPSLLPAPTLAGFPPTFLWSSVNDTVALSATQAALAAAIGADASLHEVPGSPLHGAVMAAIPPATVLAQIQSAAPL